MRYHSFSALRIRKLRAREGTSPGPYGLLETGLEFNHGVLTEFYRVVSSSEK